MNHLPFFLALVFFAQAEAGHAQFLPWSMARLGNEIHAQERAYFGLFPSIGDYESSTLARLPDSTCVITVSRRGGSDTALTLDAEEAILLERYISVFETVVGNVSPRDRSYRIARDGFGSLLKRSLIGVPDTPIQASSNLKFTMKNDSEIEAWLLGVRSPYVFISFDPTYRWKREYVALHVDQVISIRERRNPVERGMLYGAGIGAITTATLVASGVKFPQDWIYVFLGFFGGAIGGAALGFVAGLVDLALSRNAIAERRGEELLIDSSIVEKAMFPVRTPPEFARPQQPGVRLEFGTVLDETGPREAIDTMRTADTTSSATRRKHAERSSEMLFLTGGIHTAARDQEDNWIGVGYAYDLPILGSADSRTLAFTPGISINTSGIHLDLPLRAWFHSRGYLSTGPYLKSYFASFGRSSFWTLGLGWEPGAVSIKLFSHFPKPTAVAFQVVVPY